jgi:hypothetical protein
MAGFIGRVLGAAKLDAAVYEEVEQDRGAIVQAVVVVLVSSLCAGLGSAASSGQEGRVGLIAGALAALVGWIIWAVTTYLIGTRMLAEPQTSSSVGEMMRVTGFASAPGIIRVFAFIPVLGPVINWGASVWMLAAFVVAVRQALDYNGTFRAVLVCLFGWVLWVIIQLLLSLLMLS